VQCSVHGRLGSLANLAFVRWAGCLSGQVAAASDVEVGQMRSRPTVGPLIPKFKTKVLSELLNPQTSHPPSCIVILLIRGLLTFAIHCYILVTYPVNLDTAGADHPERSEREGARS